MPQPLANAGYTLPPALLEAVKQVVDEMSRLGMIQTSVGAAAYEALIGNPTDSLLLGQALAQKQNTLVSGQTIKTFGGLSLMGSGDIPAPVGTGGGAAVRVAHSLTPPLNQAGFGKVAPITPGQKTLLSVDSTFLVDPAKVEDGNWIGAYTVAANVDTSAFAKTFGDPITGGYNYLFGAFVQGGDVYFVSRQGAIVDLTAPLIGNPAMENTARNIIEMNITELNAPSLNGTLAGVILGGSGAASFTKTAVVVVSGKLRVTISGQANNTTALTIELAAGMVKDSSGNLSAAKATTVVANNIVADAPNAPTISFGPTTTTTQDIVITPGPLDATHSAANTYRLFYKATVGGTYVLWDNTTALTRSVTGLTPGLNYSFTAEGVNPGGTGLASGVISKSTTGASGALPYTTNFDAANSTTSLGLGWTDIDGGIFGIIDNEGYCVNSGAYGKSVRQASTNNLTLHGIAKFPHGSNEYVYLLRHDGADFQYVRFTTNEVTIGQIIGGTHTPLYTGAVIAGNGGYVETLIVLSGTSLALTVGGTPIVTQTVANIAGTNFGIGVWGTPSTDIRFNLFELTA